MYDELVKELREAERRAKEICTNPYRFVPYYGKAADAIEELSRKNESLFRPAVRGHWYMISYDEAGCSCCGYDRSTPFENTREAKEKWNELPPFCEMCGAMMEEN